MRDLFFNRPACIYSTVLVPVFCIAILGTPFSLGLAQDSTCRDQIERLFTFSDLGRIDVGHNCHPPTNGCIGCADEVITMTGRPIASLNSRMVSIPYHVDRIRVNGNCAGKVWNDSPDPAGPIDARIEVLFRVENGRLIVSNIAETRVNNDTRPSWAKSKLESMIRAKDGSPIDCQNTN